MATFTNYATLRYGGVTVTSNTVTGVLPDALTLTKTAVAEDYAPGDVVSYLVSLVNPGTADLTGLTVTDDLGAYAFGQGTVYPLAYTPGSLRLLVNGLPQAAPAVAPGPPLVVTGLTVPAGGTAVLAYEAALTAYAPLAEGSSITNTLIPTFLPEISEPEQERSDLCTVSTRDLPDSTKEYLPVRDFHMADPSQEQKLPDTDFSI